MLRYLAVFIPNAIIAGNLRIESSTDRKQRDVHHRQAYQSGQVRKTTGINHGFFITRVDQIGYGIIPGWRLSGGVRPGG
jgi:hypothetical protein